MSDAPTLGTPPFESRKLDHIALALDPRHQFAKGSLLDAIQLRHEALPDLNFSEVSIRQEGFLGTLETPYYIAAMTAGHARAFEWNVLLAEACAQRGWALGVGSQRREWEQNRALSGSTEWGGPLDRWSEIRSRFPQLPILANLGLSQLIQSKVSEVQALVDVLGARALVVHTNPLQEVLQPEGTPLFRDCLNSLEQICGRLSVPVVLKETGTGFSERTLQRLFSRLGSGPSSLAAIDVSGLGGTHWGRIESSRIPHGTVAHEASLTFADWGVPTPDSVLAAVEVWGGAAEVWGSGGVRTGLDAAKLIAMGATRVGFAQPALQAAQGGIKALLHWMEVRERELRIALFCTGSADLNELRAQEGVWKKRDF